MTKDGLCLLKYKTWHPWSFKRTEFNLSFVVPLFYPFWYHFINSVLFSKVTEYYSLFLKKQNKTKQNPKLTAPQQRTIGNEAPRLPAMIIIMNLCEKCHWDSATELNSSSPFYWHLLGLTVWWENCGLFRPSSITDRIQFDKKHLLSVSYNLSYCKEEGEKLICCLPYRRGRKGKFMKDIHLFIHLTKI